MANKTIEKPNYLELLDLNPLPRVKDMPQGCAWGVFDKDGEKEQLGCPNLLTPGVVGKPSKKLAKVSRPL